MGLSRLSNFIKSVRGTILYVDPNSLDSTDSIENNGNSLTRPFKTIQRALVESVKFSYQRGLNNDRFNKTTILVYPGDHLIDNRPGYIPVSSTDYLKRSGSTVSDLVQWNLNSVFDLTNPSNELYKLNSVHGGVIVPRGVSIVGMDLRKTKIRPLYVPDPENDNIERSCIFRVTGGCYFWQFTILDSDPNGNCYKNYTDSSFVPNFSHHKLTGFEYADGVNGVYINDNFLEVNESRTDLDMYYEKVAAVYQEIQPNYGTGTVDIQPVVDEYRIVGSKGLEVGISAIKAGGGTQLTATNIITVDLVDSVPDLNVDTAIQISGVSDEYDGQYVISSVISDKRITYKIQNIPGDPNPSPPNATLNIVVDTVTSTSPYIFNISLRSVYGMCGLLADGDKATGFKSMVVAQFTGIGLQKDENAFIKYNETTGEYEYANQVSNLPTNSRSRFRPEYENFHIKSTNDSFLQLVSIFAIGYAQHFVTDNGGDIALNNSNSNFGSKALVSSGFKRDAFPQDGHGFITHIIAPREIEYKETSVEFVSIDVGLTTSVGAATTDRLYLYDQTDINQPPNVLINGYYVGAKKDEKLFIQTYVNGITTSYSSYVTMPCGEFNTTQFSSEKSFTVGRSPVGINSINVDGVDILTLSSSHSFINGESVRIVSNDASLPDGVKLNQIYYVITNGSLGDDKIKLAKTYNDALNSNSFSLNQKGGVLSIVSKVSDKNPGDPGHPVQWDTIGNWYINVNVSDNQIYDTINTYGVATFGGATSRSYIKRNPNRRRLVDSLYRIRYVVPKDSPVTARPPVEGFILQESNDIIGSGDNEISQLFNFTTGSITNSSELKNSKFIASASYSTGIAKIKTELRHNLKVGDTVEVVNVKSGNNTSGAANIGYNGTHVVTSLVNSKEFTYTVSDNPGTFLNDTSTRNTSLPYFKRKKYQKTYQVYRTQEVQPYISLLQDGIYYLTLINHSNKPPIPPFNDKGYAQPIVQLYPQFDRDNIVSDPKASVSYALPDTIGEVVIDDLQNSITKETVESFAIGYGITDIKSSSGIAHTIYTSIDHGFSAITSLSIVDGGINYGSGSSGVLYNANLVGIGFTFVGSNATAKITLGANGTITGINIIDGGSAYGIGNTLAVVGVATTAGHIAAVVRVESVSDNTNDIIQISGVKSSTQYNTLYRISSITASKPKEINVVSSEIIPNFSISGIGSTSTSSSGYYQSGKAVKINSLNYNASTGLATIGFDGNHGFIVNQKIRISGANESAFNGDFIITKINSLSSLVVNIGLGINETSATGTLYAYYTSLTSHGGDLINDTENTSGRLVYEYAGITTSLGIQLNSGSILNELFITNAVSLGLNLGDYLQINSEIFRINSAVTSDNVSVFRSLLGSPRQTHVSGSIVRKINIRPVELRRNSIIRASGHTFEYLGFGPGNYSTSLPEKQDRLLSNYEKFLAQSTKSDGGIIVYTGMNGEGDFFAGNKKINSVTGKEETFDTPFPTNTGEREINDLVNITETQKLFVNNSIRVDGGKDKNTVSEFDGPVVFSNKITSSSDIEANNILIQGNQTVSRKLSVSDSIPSSVGNYGDVVFNAVPSVGDNVGWIYSTDNTWTEFGTVSPNDTSGVGIFKQVGIATNSPQDSLLRVGAGSSLVVIDDTGAVGIATTANGYKLNVNGSIRADYFYGDGSNLTNISIPSTGWTQVTKGLYNTDLNNVGIGTTDPTSTLTVLGDTNISGVLTAGIVTTNSITAITGNFTNLNVSGMTTLNNLNVSGIITATSGIVTYYGDGSKLTGIAATTVLLDSRKNFIVGGGSSAGCNNNFIGDFAGKTLLNTSFANNFFGKCAGYYAAGSCNNIMGNTAGYCSKGCHNNFFGTQAGYANQVANDNNFFGRQSGYNNGSGSRNNFFGVQSGYNFGNANDNNFFGSYSGYNNSSGNGNNFIGFKAGCSNNSGCNNIYLGSCAGFANVSGNQNIVIGQCRSTPIINGCNQLVIGSGTQDWINGNSSYNVGIGITNPSAKLHVVGSALISGNSTIGGVQLSSNAITTPLSGISSIGGIRISGGIVQANSGIVTYYGDGSNLTGFRQFLSGTNLKINTFNGGSPTYSPGGWNLALGLNAGFSNVGGSYNNFIGQSAGYNNIGGSYNTFIGSASGYNNVSGTDNNAIGSVSGYWLTTGTYNVLLGSAAGYGNSTGNRNIFLGYAAGYTNYSGNDNVYIGPSAGYNSSTGNNNVVIGAYRDVPNPTGSNQLAIGSGNKDWITGDSSYNVFFNLTSSSTLSSNSQMTFQLVSNTQLRIKVRGTDGVTRSVTLTLA